MTQRKLLRLQRRRGQEPFVYRSFRFDKRGLTPVGTPTRAQWSECLDYVMDIEKNIHFWIGDLLNYGESRWGEMYSGMVEQTGYDPVTLRTLKWVAGRVDVSRRRESLSFAHHQEVAGLPPEQQDAVLARAERDGWTREMVRHEVNRRAYETKRPDGPPIVSGLHHGDCLQVMATLPDESIDLLLVDPPYGVDGLKTGDALDQALTDATAKLKPNSHVYVFATWQTYAGTATMVARHFDLHNTLVWVRNADEVGERCYMGQQGVVLFAHRGRRHLNGGRDSNVLYFDGVAAPRHPEEKPVALLRYLIEKSTQKKEAVLDPFMGSGSSCVAARDAGRRYVGVEIDRPWYELAVHRLAPTPEV